MQSQDLQIASPPSSAWPRRLGMAAAVSAVVLVTLLGVRRITDLDIGYHLAYGESFLQTGHIVQTNQFIYTRFDPAILAAPGNLGPGNTYDPATNTYHFPNANWLSQVAMAMVYRIGGVNGLNVLQAALVAGMFVLLLAVLRQMGLGWAATAAAMLLATLVGYERFNLRPELFGYIILLAEWLLLSRGQFGRRHAAGVILLQVLAVNVHSYFLPAIALAGAVLMDQLLRMAWARWVAGQPIPAEREVRAKWLGVALAGMVAASLANPWTWCGAIFPIQTLLYLGKHHILGQEAQTGLLHPWAVIVELYGPFAPSFAGALATWAYYVLLGLAGVAAVAGLLRRRWGLLLAMGGMLSISLNLRRNMTASAIIVIPCAAAILHEAGQWLADQRRRRKPTIAKAAPHRRIAAAWLPGIASVVVLVACLGLSVWTVTNGWYFFEGRLARFGLGWSRMTMPVSAAEWITRKNPSGRVFTDQNVSSNLLFLTRPHRNMPVLTNTWAFPPYVMSTMLDLVMGKRDFDKQMAPYDVQTAVLSNSALNMPLIRRLAGSKDWAVVDLDVAHVAFVRRDGPNAALARAEQILPESLDVDRLAARMSAADPVPAFALNNAAKLLHLLGWDEPALQLWERCVPMRADYAEPRNMLGLSLAVRGTQTLQRMEEANRANRFAEGDRLKIQVLADWQRARDLFLEAIRLQSDYAGARQNLSLLESRMASLGRAGQIRQ